MTNQENLKGSVIAGFINAAINAGIQYFTFKKLNEIPVSLDLISNKEVTVFGTTVTVALTLAVVLTLVAYFTLKVPKIPFYPKVLLILLKNVFFTFGVVTAFAVLWQYKFGTLYVSPISATIIVGIIGFVVAAIVNYLTVGEVMVDHNK